MPFGKMSQHTTCFRGMPDTFARLVATPRVFGAATGRCLLIMLSVLLGACAGTPPLGLEAPEPDGPSQREAQQDPARVRGQRVRWGGEILSVTNNAQDTEIEIYGRPLSSDAEPMPNGGEGVRFIAVIKQFLDPAQYGAGKRLTVSGTLAGKLQRPVGEYLYAYPVVEAQSHYLWPVYQPPVAPASWRYPYYDPWWPWGPYRYWPHYWW